MRPKSFLVSALCAATVSLMAGCSTPPAYTGPGCLIQIYGSPNLQGPPLPIRQDTDAIAAPWNQTASSAKVIYGTWRLFTDPGFNGFMGDYQAPADVLFLVPARKLGSVRCLRSEPAPPPRY